MVTPELTLLTSGNSLPRKGQKLTCKESALSSVIRILEAAELVTFRIKINSSYSAHPPLHPASIAHLCSVLGCSTFGKGSKAGKSSASTQYHRPTHAGGQEQSAWLLFPKTPPCEQRWQQVSLHQSGLLWNVLPQANACHSRVW